LNEVPVMSRRPLLAQAEVGRRRRVLIALAWYSVNIHRGITRFAFEAGWILDGGHTRTGLVPRGWDGDGVLAVMGVQAELDRALKRLKKPMVNIGYARGGGVVSVCADGVAIGKLAADHFRSRGFRHYAYVMWQRTPGEQQRWEGFSARVREHGYAAELVGPLVELQEDEPTSDRLRWLAVKIAALEKPVAILCEYDDRAIRVIDAALMSGLRVPEQVAVLGVDNDELRCPFAAVPLSSIDNNEERIGYEAARLLGEMFEGRRPERDVTLIPPRSVVVRQSTNILAIPHEEVALALKLIWTSYTEHIDVATVADKVPLSYPQLHNAFVKHVGHTMAEELTRRRIEHAQRLLSESDTKMSEVARLSGFGSADRMGRVFHRKLGMTPSDYRMAAATRRAPGEGDAQAHVEVVQSQSEPIESAKPALLRPAESRQGETMGMERNQVERS
jgi:LacI family transcriptional regulator